MTFNDLDLLRRIKNLTIGQFVKSFVTNMSVMGLTAKQISLMSGHSQQRVVDIYDKTKAESNALSVVELLKGKV